MMVGARADGDAVFDEETHYLQCFYYPEACTPADGPTEILPGSHLWPMQTTPRSMDAPGGRAGTLTSCAAGTVFVTDYPILHRRSASTNTGVRNNLKFNYFRTRQPEPGVPDWLPSSPPFQLHAADFSPTHSIVHLEDPKATGSLKQSASRLVAKKFFWL